MTQLARITIYLILLATAAGVTVLLCGCGPVAPPTPPLAPPASKIATPERTRDVAQKVTEIAPQLHTISDTINSLTPSTVEAVRPVLQSEIKFVIDDFTDLTKKGGKIELLTTSVASDVTEKNTLIQQLKDSNDKIKKMQDSSGQREKLEGWGFLFLVPGIICLIAGAALMSYFPKVAKALLIIGGGSALAGIAFLTLATFILPIEIAVLIVGGTVFVAGIVLLVVWLVKRYSATLTAAKSIVSTIEDVKKAGAIDMTKAATIFNAGQTTTAKAIVSAVQAKGGP